jgi:predicted dehydrogenase
MDSLPKLRIGFLGTGKISIEHALAAKALGHVIVAGSTTSRDSPRWKAFLSAASDTRFEPAGESLLTDPDIDAVVSCLPWNVTEKWLPKLLSTPKPVLIEKPLALSSAAVEDALSCHGARPDNKIVGFNRRFYAPVQKLRERLSMGGMKSAEIIVSEAVSRLVERYGSEIIGHVLAYSSSHILDTATYLLGKLKPVRVYGYKENGNVGFCSFTGILETEKAAPVILSINADNPVPVGIRVFFDDKTTWHLSPMERLVAYKGYEVIEPSAKNKIRQYKPKPFLESVADAKMKPGFLKQMRAFTSNEKGIAATPGESAELLRLIEEITRSAA